MKKAFIIPLLILFVLACTSPKIIHENLISESYKILESNLYFLASDELEGRDATSQGEKVAAQFIVNQLQQYGVEPFGDEGTYFQNFELQKSTILPSSNLTFQVSDVQKELELNNEFIPFRGAEALQNSDLIFVGHGVYDSALNYDDYQDIDVNGKTVICLSGVPKGLEISEDLAKHNRSTKKASIAAAKGAKGVLVLQSASWAKRWERLIKYSTRSSIGKKMDPNTSINAVWIDTVTAKTLFEQEGLKYSELIDTLASGLIKVGAVLDTKVSINIEQEIEMLPARNVVGIVKGNKPSVQNEIITVGAHYDHVGMQGEDVYNGADDNGSGTVAILESARQISSLKTNHRPVVYIFYTGEEKGLLGSEHFANNSEYIDNIIVNINIDMVGRDSEDTLFVVGSGKLSSELYDIVEHENKVSTKFHFDYTYDDEGHPERIYYRSDQWSFAQKGIPVAFLTDMHSTDYHKPTDTADKINYKKLVKVSALTTSITLNIANLDHKLIKDNLVLSEK